MHITVIKVGLVIPISSCLGFISPNLGRILYEPTNSPLFVGQILWRPGGREEPGVALYRYQRSRMDVLPYQYTSGLAKRTSGHPRLNMTGGLNGPMTILVRSCKVNVRAWFCCPLAIALSFKRLVLGQNSSLSCHIAGKAVPDSIFSDFPVLCRPFFLTLLEGILIFPSISRYPGEPLSPIAIYSV
jgi:hypothetical protein